MPDLATAAPRVVTFDSGRSLPRDLLGGKGAGLVEMHAEGLPVPPGLIITTAVCRDVRGTGELPPEVFDDVRTLLTTIEHHVGRRFGDPQQPLLVAVRSGAPESMPGMMDTVLNLGMNDDIEAALATASGADFARDAHRRFLEAYGGIVLGLEGRLPALADPIALRTAIAELAGEPVPEDPHEQLRQAISAVIASWDSPRAKAYRGLEGIDDDLGTAVVVQAMVFGNHDDDSATGVAFTRDPNTGERVPYGDVLFGAQGEDVVSGRFETLPLAALDDRLPTVAAELRDVMQRLEQRVGDLCDIEFTVESGRLYLLQIRRGKRAAVAAVRIAVEMVEEGLIDRAEAVRRIRARDLERLDRPYLDPTASYRVLTTGLAASPGVATGRVCLSSDGVASEVEDVILVRPETSPRDVHGMAAAAGILTARGGLVSHAAVVARDLGKPAVVGATQVVPDEAARVVRIADEEFPEGTVLTIDGGTGEVVEGAPRLVVPGRSQHLTTLLAWADEVAGDEAVPDGTPRQRLRAAHRALEPH
ncbi:MAG: pyruvate, phosphate dikinase [Actinobacteria bacterium]|nr:pyruvate, phosphate dikinase [Actinomycetota bacterium]